MRCVAMLRRVIFALFLSNFLITFGETQCFIWPSFRFVPQSFLLSCVDIPVSVASRNNEGGMLSLNFNNLPRSKVALHIHIRDCYGRPDGKIWAPSARSRTTYLGAVKFKNFDEMLATYHDQVVLVSWNAEFCGPCKLMKKELKRVREVLGDKVLIFNLDTERFPSLGARFDIAGLPTILLFKEGIPIHRIEGVKTSKEIIQQIQDYL